MAIQIEGILKTEWGDTPSAYIRIEFYKVKPWVGEVEYNPLLFWTSSDSPLARKEFYQAENPQTVYCIPWRNLEYESGSVTGSIDLPDVISFPLTSSETVEQTINHYTESITSSSRDVIDFDEDGNEVVTTEWTYVTESVVYSQSLANWNRINLDNLTDIYDQCYVHLKQQLSQTIPSSSILDV